MEGSELRSRRERLGLSVGQLAREFGVIPSSIYRWEGGAIPLHGLTAIGADTVLKRLERRQRPAGGREDGAD